MRQHPLRFYHTLCGPVVSCAAQVYDLTSNNTALALTRLTGCREPKLFGWCERLYEQQFTALTNMDFIQPLLQYLNTLRASCAWPAFKGVLAEELEHYADTHPKKKERINAMVNMMKMGRPLGTRCRGGKVSGKLKIEIAKSGKVPRLYVNVGVEPSLVGAWLAKLLKTIMADNPWVTNSSYVKFVPTASYHDLKFAFDLLHHPQTPFTMLLFSDDASAAFMTPNGIQYADLDISSCDKSHGNELFTLLYQCVPVLFHAELTFVLDQLKAILEIRSPDDWRVKVKLIPKHYTLYSGSVLTTVVNNLANLLIAHSISRSRATTPKEVVDAAASVGYIITYKKAPTIHQVQFLKHSPAYDKSGILQPVLNMGVFLRAIGLCSRDLPGQGDLYLRARQHAAAIATCSWPNTHFPLIESFRHRFRDPSKHTIREYLREHPDRDLAWPELYFTDDEVLKRYKYNPDGSLYTCGWTQLHQFMHTADVFTITAGPDLSHVLTLDYDMNTLSYLDALFEPYKL